MGERITKKQRQYILDRDDHHTQMRTYSEEKGWTTEVAHCATLGEGCETLHVHHLIPSRAGGDTLPDNLLTIAECQHTGRCQAGKIRHG